MLVKYRLRLYKKKKKKKRERNKGGSVMRVCSVWL